MKKNYLPHFTIILSISICFLFTTSVFAQKSTLKTKNTIIYQNNFDNYSNGDYLALSDDIWDTWSNSPGSSEDGVISNDYSSTAPHSVKISSASDLIFPFGNKTSGTYTVSFDMFIPSGKSGYFNLQHVFGSEWAVSVYLYNDLSSEIQAGGQVITNFTYQANNWFNISFNIDLDNDDATMYSDNNEIANWQWSLKADGTDGENQLACANMYAWGDGNNVSEYYFDNFSYVLNTEELVPPTINVDKENIVIYMEEDDTFDETFEISNIGEQDLEFNIYPVYNIDGVIGDDLNEIGYAGDCESGIGYVDAIDCKRAVLLLPSLQEDYIGTALKSIKFYMYDESSNLAVKIWGENESMAQGPGEVLYSFPHTPVVNDWNVVEITEQIILDGTPIYIGLEYHQPADRFSMGADDGPKIQGVNWMSFGPGWQQLNMDRNFCIKANVIGDPQPAYISVTPNSGIVSPNGKELVEVSIDSEGLALGDYYGEIVVASNDPSNPYETVDMHVSVQDEVSGPVMKVNPIIQNVNLGEVFETTIEINDVINLGSYELSLSFSPEYLQVNSVELGGFLGSTGRPTLPIEQNIDNLNGTVDYAITTLGGNPPGPNGEGVLLVIEWTANSDLTEDVLTNLNIESGQATFPSGEAFDIETENGQVNITTCYQQDFDCDCDVDIIDVSMAAYCYGTRSGDEIYNGRFDFDNDGDIDIVDITVVTYNYGWECDSKKQSAIALKEELNNNVRLIQEEFTLENNEKELLISVENIYQLGAYEMGFQYRTNNIEIIEIIQENMLIETSRKNIIIENKIDDVNGLIHFAVSSLGNKVDGASGDGKLLRIKYRTKNTSEGDDFIFTQGQLARIDAEIIPFKSTYKSKDIANLEFDIFPNPNKGSFTIQYQIEEADEYSFSIYSVSGNKQNIVFGQKMEVGSYELIVRDLELPSGIYLLCMDMSGRMLKTQKLIIK